MMKTATPSPSKYLTVIRSSASKIEYIFLRNKLKNDGPESEIPSDRFLQLDDGVYDVRPVIFL